MLFPIHADVWRSPVPVLYLSTGIGQADIRLVSYEDLSPYMDQAVCGSRSVAGG